MTKPKPKRRRGRRKPRLNEKPPAVLWFQEPVRLLPSGKGPLVLGVMDDAEIGILELGELGVEAMLVPA